MQRLLTDMDTVGGQIDDVATYGTDEVFNSTAFEYEIPLTGVSVLKPISDALKECGGVIDEVKTGFQEKWKGLTAAVALSAKDYETADGEQMHTFLQAYLDLVDKP
ncbi:hypothetical protein G5V59_11000 [Nocardioides sp. W3-2-3]|uniref:hypothetical protein n=1 Tax=Nocardioides convexus TaxID=2712224 RepID=UPI0024184CCA|nr:hypothetical protein [Nocardioides convexus]NHA00420.1 hypothetical protein [Nocardioides convexus]